MNVVVLFLSELGFIEEPESSCFFSNSRCNLDPFLIRPWPPFLGESVPKVDLVSHISSFVTFAKGEKNVAEIESSPEKMPRISCHLETFRKKMTHRTFHHQQKSRMFSVQFW